MVWAFILTGLSLLYWIVLLMAKFHNQERQLMWWVTELTNEINELKARVKRLRSEIEESKK